MVQETLLGFPAHTLPYRSEKFYRLIEAPRQVLNLPGVLYVLCTLCTLCGPGA